MRTAEIRATRTLVEIIGEFERGTLHMYWCKSLIGSKFFTVLSTDLRMFAEAEAGAEGTATSGA